MRVSILFKRLVLGLALVSPLVVGAQEVQTKAYDMYFPFTPDGLPHGAPSWMSELSKPQEVNFYQMMRRYSAYLDATPEARVKAPRVKAVVNYFQRWRRIVEPYVKADGSIQMPPMSMYRDQVKTLERADDLRSSAPGVDGWKLLSPIVTYDVEHKRVSPAQANVQRMDVAPSNPNILFAGTETGMIFKSVDKGEHWTPCRPLDYFGGEITTVEISETNPDKVLVGAGATLWLTTDGGDTWRNITPSGIRGYQRIRDAVLKRDNDRHILMGNDHGLYLSENDGQSWRMVQRGQTFDIKFKRNDHQTVYAMVRTGAMNAIAFMRSRDAGRTFETIKIGEKHLNSARIGLSDAPNGADYIYVWGCELSVPYHQFFYNGPAILYKSTDAGATWTENTSVSDQLEPQDRKGGQGYYDMVVAASPTDPEVLLVGLLHLYRSSDGGRTFSNRGGYYGNKDYGNFDLHCDMQDLNVIGGDAWLSTDGGVIYSSDFFDRKAEAKIHGIYASEVWGFDQGWNEDIMVGGRNHNGNMSQLARHGGITMSMRGSEVATGYVFLSNPRRIGYSDTGDVVLVPDDWQNEYVPFYRHWQYYPSESLQYGMGFEYDPRDARRFIIMRGNDDESRRKLWRTTDDGESFTELHTFDNPISAYAISRANPNKMVIATVGKLYQSLDDGQTFELLNTHPDMEYTTKFKIALHPTRENEIWVSNDEPGGFYRTTDNGATWEQLSAGLDQVTIPNPKYPNEKFKISRFFLTGNEENAVYAIANVMRDKDDYYSAYRGKILYRDDNTNGWVDYSAGLPSVISLNRMLPFYKEGKIRLATNNGVWERSLRRPKFRPIAQPLIVAEERVDAGRKRIKLESYSIVNQDGAQWTWSFRPEPLMVSDRNVRNPIIEVDADQTYDITLVVKTPEGESSRTIESMLRGKKPVPLSVTRPDHGVRDLTAVPSSVRSGEGIRFTSVELEEAVLVYLFATDGREVGRFSLAPGAEYTFSTEGLAPGTYFYSVPRGVIRKVGRFVVK